MSPKHRKKDRIGLTVLAPDDFAESREQCDVDIVAVHGLNGGSIHSWTAGDCCWLRDLLPRTFPTARILTFGYNANIVAGTAPGCIADLAEALMNGLCTERTQAPNRPLIFLCHSMGGLVAKKCLLRSSLRSSYQPIASATVGMVFFGTPHLGSSLGALASIVNRIATAMKFTSPSRAPADLKAHAPGLQEINADFVDIANRISIVSFFEQRDHTGAGKVVENWSSRLRHPNESAFVGLDADHQHMIRYSNSDDPNYQEVQKYLIPMIAEARVGRSQHMTQGNDTMRDLSQRPLRSVLHSSSIVPKSFHPIPPFTTKFFSKAFDSLSAEASFLLTIAALLDPDEVSHDLLRVHATPLASQYGVNLEGARYTNAIRQLRQNALLKRDPKRKVVSMYRLVQEAMIRQWTPEKMQLVFDRAAICLSNAYPRQIKGQSMFKDWEACDLITPHLLHLARHYEFFKPTLKRSLEFANLLGHCGWYLWERRQNDAAFDVLMIAKKTCESLLAGKPHATTAFVYSNLGGIHNTRGERVEAAKMSRIVVEMREACLEPDDQDIATAYNNYAADLNSLDHWDPKINEYYKKALAILTLPGNIDKHPELHGQTLSNAGRYWARIQRYPEAVKALQEAIKLRSRGSNMQSPTAAFSIYGLANVMLAQCKHDEALKLHQQCLDIRKALDPTSFWTGVSYHKVATLVYQKDGTRSATRALELIDEAVVIFRNAQAEPGLLARSLYKRSQILSGIADTIGDQSQLEKSSTCLKEAIQATGKELPSMPSEEDFDGLVQFDHR